MGDMGTVGRQACGEQRAPTPAESPAEQPRLGDAQGRKVMAVPASLHSGLGAPMESEHLRITNRFRTGNTCTPVADPCQFMAKPM